MTSTPLLTSLTEAIAVLEASPSLALRELSDLEFADATRLSARLLRLVQARTAAVAGEVAYRSRPELGSGGLAHRLGHRTPEAMVRALTGSTSREAFTAVRVGRLLDSDPGRPWLDPVGIAVAAGTLTVSGAEAIAAGLGSPSPGVTDTSLAAAAAVLASDAGDLDADRLFRLAREARDDLDEAGISDREAHRHTARSLTVHRQPDGMVRLVWLLDPESAATVLEVFDRATSPRRGGPRFVSGPGASDKTAELAKKIATDERSTPQIASDTFLQLLQTGATTDTSQLLGSGGPVIRILVTADSLSPSQSSPSRPPSPSPSSRPWSPSPSQHESGHGFTEGHGSMEGHGFTEGHGFIEGHADPIGATTLDRLACTGSTTRIAVNFDGQGGGQPLDVGREQRLFTRNQRIALAARDGGCRWPGCDRPPSWSEAHHIDHWEEDHGRTDMAEGILLCKHHHLTLHNNHWKISRAGNDYFLHPPPDVDAAQHPIAIPTKSRAWEEATRAVG